MVADEALVEHDVHGKTASEIHPLWIFRVAGTQEAMGAALGRAFAQAGHWRAVLDFYRAMPAHLIAGRAQGLGGRAAHWGLGKLVDAWLRQLDASRPARFRARSHAQMAALGLGAGEARYQGVMDVFQNLVGAGARLGLAGLGAPLLASAAPGCSTLVAWGEATRDGRLLHARNFDFPGVGLWERHPCVVLCKPADGVPYGFVSTVGADAPGVTAFNAEGIALTVHTRFHRQVRIRGRSILDVGHAAVWRARTLADAVAEILSGPIASTWGIVVSSARERRAVCVEVHGSRAAVVDVPAERPWVACTNHYLDPSMQPGEVSPMEAFEANTRGRFAQLERAGRAGGLDVAALQGLLGSHDDPQVPGAQRSLGGTLAQPITVQSVVFDLERGVVHTTCGGVPVSRGAWRAVRIDWDGPAVDSLDGAPEVTAVGPLRPGYAAFRRAVAGAQSGATPEQVRAWLDVAVREAPEDPCWQMLAGLAALPCGDLGAAAVHFDDAVEHEAAPFQRGRALLWAARTAEALGRREQAEDYRAALLDLDDPLLARSRARARAERREPPGPARLRRVRPNLMWGDALLA